MGGGHSDNVVRVSATDSHGGQQKAFSHGGAGSVQAEEGDLLLTGGVGGADALVEQIPRQNIVQILRLQLQLAFRLMRLSD